MFRLREEEAVAPRRWEAVFGGLMTVADGVEGAESVATGEGASGTSTMVKSVMSERS